MSRTTPLTVTLPDDLDAFIRERVAAGRFASPSDAVRAAVALLERAEREGELTRDEIRREILIGIEQAEAGHVRDAEKAFQDIRHADGPLRPRPS
ncbi:MAG: type II toxin-antitoxin system ParD family antitoxin [Vicinamibacterales bacterium]